MNNYSYQDNDRLFEISLGNLLSGKPIPDGDIQCTIWLADYAEYIDSILEQKKKPLKSWDKRGWLLRKETSYYTGDRGSRYRNKK